MSTPSTILVVGATGRQGSSVLTELANLLSASPSPTKTTKIKVLALTRSASSPKAQALASEHPTLDLEVVEGDSRRPEPIFAAHPAIDAVFSYTTPPDEEPQAVGLVDAAAAHARSASGRKVHFVFSSVDRGGEPASWDTPTDIEHFEQKHNVEVHLRNACDGSGGALTYTILRPVAFMDNCEYLFTYLTPKKLCDRIRYLLFSTFVFHSLENSDCHFSTVLATLKYMSIK